MAETIKKKQWVTPEIILLATDAVNAPNKALNAGHEASFKSVKSVFTRGTTAPYAFFNDGHKVRIGNAATANWFS